jgi:hypothetical protein
VQAAVLAGRDLGLPLAVELPLLAAGLRGGRAGRLPGRLLLGRHRLLVRGQVPAVPAQGAVAQVGDLVDLAGPPGGPGAVVAADLGPLGRAELSILPSRPAGPPAR